MLEPYGELKRKKRPAEAVAALEEQFPGFAVHLIPGHHGEERFEAVRRGGSDGDGLYAVLRRPCRGGAGADARGVRGFRAASLAAREERAGGVQDLARCRGSVRPPVMRPGLSSAGDLQGPGSPAPPGQDRRSRRDRAMR